MSGISMAEVHAEAIALLDYEFSLSLVNLAAVASPTTLDLTRTAAAVDSAPDCLSTPSAYVTTTCWTLGWVQRQLAWPNACWADRAERLGSRRSLPSSGRTSSGCRRTRRSAPSRTFRAALWGARSRASSGNSSVSSWTRCRPIDSCRRSGSTSVRRCLPALVAARCVRCSTWRRPRPSTPVPDECRCSNRRVMIAPQLPVDPPSLWGSVIQECVLLTPRVLLLRLPR
jgi:hypothetical protein